jgi:hypothetical protein
LRINFRFAKGESGKNKGKENKKFLHIQNKFDCEQKLELRQKSTPLKGMLLLNQKIYQTENFQIECFKFCEKIALFNKFVSN